MKALAGVAVPARVAACGPAFEEALLFTHRGLSGPACLQASSYWREGAAITVDLDPGAAILPDLRAARQRVGRKAPVTILAEHLPARPARMMAGVVALPARLGDCADADLDRLNEAIRGWRLTPAGPRATARPK